MRILITGGAGFIGSHLVEHYQGKAEIVVLDNLRSGYKRNLDGLDHTFIYGSVTDEAVVAAAMQGVDFVFHLAALISVPESIENPRECVDINVNGLLTVLDAAAKAGVRKFILASSAAIYGDNPTDPKIENMLPEPKSPYAITKLDGEYYLEMFRREYGLETASLRFFNVFGPRQDPNSAYAAAVPIFIQKALAGDDLTIFGDGLQTRDFIHVKDVAATLAHAASTSSLTGAHNVGYGDSITVLALAQKIIELSGSSSRILHAPERSGDVRHSRADVHRLISSGFSPKGSLMNGLHETLEAFSK